MGYVLLIVIFQDEYTTSQPLRPSYNKQLYNNHIILVGNKQIQTIRQVN